MSKHGDLKKKLEDELEKARLDVAYYGSTRSDRVKRISALAAEIANLAFAENLEKAVGGQAHG